jgi:hypothetical protein
MTLLLRFRTFLHVGRMRLPGRRNGTVSQILVNSCPTVGRWACRRNPRGLRSRSAPRDELWCAELIDDALRAHTPTRCLPAVASSPSRSITETAGHLRAHVADAAPAADAI